MPTTNTPDPIILRLAEICDAAFDSRAELAEALGLKRRGGRVTILLGSKEKPATMSPSLEMVQRVLDAVNAKTGKNYQIQIIEQ